MEIEANIQNTADRAVRKAALVSGIGLLIMVLTAPIAEMVILPKLVNTKEALTTLDNITDNKGLFTTAIFLYLITFIADVVVAWGLYIFFRPADRFFSLLTAWFRLIYTAMAIIGLFNLLKVLQLIENVGAVNSTESLETANEAVFYITSFRLEWGIAFIFFGICLGLLGVLALKSSYVPKYVGIALGIAGLGYLINSLQPYFFPNLDTSFLMITFFGELVFMVWLLIKGWKVKT